MAELALTLPAVIASPSDVALERDLIQSIIDSEQKRAAGHRLLLEAVRWERDMRPTMGRPQSAFNDDHLRRAELVVFLFGSSLGSPSSPESELTGTLEELRLAQTLVRTGSTDDLFVYFRRGQEHPAYEGRVQTLRNEMAAAKVITFWDYADLADLEVTFRRHFSSWLERWFGVPEICEETMWKEPPQLPADSPLHENRLHGILLNFDPDRHRDVASTLGGAAVQAYQHYGPDAYGLPVPSAVPFAQVEELCSPDHVPPASRPSLLRSFRPESPTPLKSLADGTVRFASGEWFFFFCAYGLLEAVIAGREAAVERYPYVNPVHQYLAALIETRSESRERFVATLVEWLGGKTGGKGRPIVRNFAAYVLGMIGASEAEDQLASAARDDAGQDVRTYAICALGKLRSRRHLGRLVKLRARASDERERLLLGQAICRITGVAHYEL